MARERKAFPLSSLLMITRATSGNYAGELMPQEAWALLKSDPDAVLVDVRTLPEWTYVGIPDLASLGRTVACVEWQSYPEMRVNSAFVGDVERAAQLGNRKDPPLLFICRSGARSRAAAMAMTAAGYSRAYNVTEGFEGDLDSRRHRSSGKGWKAANLPWKQT
jgi:rhodanese-related sulfurtransferase